MYTYVHMHIQAKLNRWMRSFGAMAINLPAIRTEPAEASFKRILFFSGKMNLNWGRHYSLGVRQVHMHGPPCMPCTCTPCICMLPVSLNWGRHHSLGCATRAFVL